MLRPLVVAVVLAVSSIAAASAQPAVQVDTSHMEGLTLLKPETLNAAIHDYLESWQAFRSAYENNSTDSLDRYFAGAARDKMKGAINEQSRLGMKAVYRDREHSIQVVFYSPEGLSIELMDTVDYTEQVSIPKNTIAPMRMQTRFAVILSPAEARWKVRVLQALPEEAR